MYPGYRGVSSYPYQRSPMPSNQYFHPNWEATPPQAKENPASSSFMYEPWSHNFGHPTQVPCHNCCSHGQYPPYYDFRPPYPHFPPPPPPPPPAYNHFCGGYPAYPPHPYPSSYAPPPHYTTELPRYEFDKSGPGEYHCCGCPNHQCHTKGGKNVRIEEQEPEVETKKSESLVPTRSNNFPYPILWVPPGFTMNKEQPRKLVETEADEQHTPSTKKPHWKHKPVEAEAENRVSPYVKKPQQSVQTVDPSVRYGWFPLDMNSIRQLMESGDGRKARDQGNESEDEKTRGPEKNKQNTQFSYPIIWLPSGSWGEDRARDHGEKNADKSPGEEPSSTFKGVPMKFVYPDSEAEKQRTAEGDHSSGVGTQATERASNLKTIPVKQLGESVLTSPSKEAQKEDKTPASIAVQKENTESARNGTNTQSSSPTKKSKLPPICLRVDPPKKKNGSSRSPSPPGDKKRQVSDDSKSREKDKEPGPSEKEIKVSEAIEKIPSQKNIEVTHGANEDKKGSNVVEEKAADAEKKVAQEIHSVKSGDARSGDDNGVRAQQEQTNKPKRKILSETEAACIIQSAYRGYQVRRWEPLKKLRQIAKVHEEAREVKKRIEDLESRAGSSIDAKEKVAVGETIMKLLLKLDTIQGLHQSIRDVRRSVAKELTVLQEKLDSIASQNSTPTVEEASIVEAAEEPSKVSCSSEGKEVTKATTEETPKVSTSSEGSEVEDNNAKAFGETAETLPVCMEPCKESQDQDAVSLTTPAAVPERIPEMEEKEIDGSETALAEPQKLSDELVPNEDTTVEVNEEVVDLLAELPQEVIEDNEREISEMKGDSGISLIEEPIETPEMKGDLGINALKQEPIEDVGSTIVPEEDVGSTIVPEEEVAVNPADGNEGLNLLAELPQEIPEDDAKELISQVLSSETMENDQEINQLNEKPELTTTDEIVAIEPESCKPVSNHDQNTQESESLVSSIDIDIPISEQQEISLKENEDEETKQNSQMSNNKEFSAENQAKIQEENECPKDQEVVVTHPEKRDDDSQQCENEVVAAASKQVSVTGGCENEEKVDKRVMEENERLREMLEKLIASEKEQQDVISSLSGKLKDLEKKLGRKKRMKSSTKRPKVVISGPSCGKPYNGFSKGRPMGVAL